MSLLDRAIVSVLPAVPRRIVRRLSSPYIAGTDLAAAMATVAGLNASGKLATVDVLGEVIGSAGEARAITETYLAVLDAIAANKLDANVSIKPTGLGLLLGYDVCRENVELVARRATDHGTFVRIDMEDSSTTDDTLRLYRELRADGYENLGVVLQASLRRTLADAEALAVEGVKVRLCKGIYVEPAALQFGDFDAVRASYVSALETLLDAGCQVGIATHDDWLIEQALRIIGERGLAPHAYEFQMLLGVRPATGDRLVADGHPLRIYVPFGSKWYEYSLRRLKENPMVAGYIAAGTLDRLRGSLRASRRPRRR